MCWFSELVKLELCNSVVVSAWIKIQWPVSMRPMRPVSNQPEVGTNSFSGRREDWEMAAATLPEPSCRLEQEFDILATRELLDGC